MHPDPVALCHGRSPAEHSLISLKPEHVSSQPLPSSFGLGPNVYIEYHIEASLLTQGYKPVIATRPLTLHCLGPATVVPDPGLTISTRPVCLKSLSLHLGKGGAIWTLKQKAKQLLDTTSIPRFSCFIRLSAPSVIQLNHPTPIPLLLQALPAPRDTSEDIHDVSTEIFLRSLSMEIEAHTHILCPVRSQFSSKERRATSDHTQRVKICFDKWLDELKGSGNIAIPYGENTECLDIGEHLNLKMDRQWVYVFGQKAQQIGAGDWGLEPTFTTYNIRRTYQMWWTATVSILGERKKVVGRVEKLVIVAEQANDANISAEVPPPPFIEYENGGISMERAGGGSLPTYGEATIQGVAVYHQ